MKFSPAQPVTLYRSRCTNCGTTLTLFVFDTPDEAIESAVADAAWTKRTSGPGGWRVELLCTDCQTTGAQ